MGLNLKAEFYLTSASVDIPVPFVPIDITLEGKLGAGASFKAGYIPGSNDNRFFGIGAAFGYGFELSVKPRD